ncbi:hypothetical protein ACSBL2_08980 [Pedobacter sp. AW31-3R]|uniref:hypothetical protein n=1 Tax=Pedobacter sp. AW31-3R TaxID=3445781 RepID=UPI003FA0DBDE
MKEYTLNTKTAELFKMVILDEHASDTLENKEYKSSLAKQLSENHAKLSRARELLLAGDLEGTEYKNIKSDCEENVVRLEALLEEAKKKKYKRAQLEPILDRSILTLSQLSVIFSKSGVIDKRRLIGSMCVEKFDLFSLKHRTADLTQLFRYIYLINKTLESKKKGTKNL